MPGGPRPGWEKGAPGSGLLFLLLLLVVLLLFPSPPSLLLALAPPSPLWEEPRCLPGPGRYTCPPDREGSPEKAVRGEKKGEINK